MVLLEGGVGPPTGHFGQNKSSTPINITQIALMNKIPTFLLTSRSKYVLRFCNFVCSIVICNSRQNIMTNWQTYNIYVLPYTVSMMIRRYDTVYISYNWCWIDNAPIVVVRDQRRAQTPVFGTAIRD